LWLEPVNRTVGRSHAWSRARPADEKHRIRGYARRPPSDRAHRAPHRILRRAQPRDRAPGVSLASSTPRPSTRFPAATPAAQPLTPRSRGRSGGCLRVSARQMCWWACASRVKAGARRRPDDVVARDETEVRAGAGSTRSSRPVPWRSERLAVTGSVDKQHRQSRSGSFSPGRVNVPTTHTSASTRSGID
jgi:hypothetical protein